MMPPAPILACLNRLEDAGYQCWCVGGCVRDWRLGRMPHDYDLCTDATPEEMKAIFRQYDLVLAGQKHGTVGVITPEGVVEITTFRTESGYRDNRHPDQVAFVTSVEEDLARRDFTINAMAWNPHKGLCDPFGGQEDLQKGILRSVGDPETRFQEDSLRILRGVRFAVRFHLQPEEKTLQAMISLSHLMDNLARERIFEELCKLITLAKGEDLLLYQPILTAAIPELRPCVGFDQHNRHHIYDVYTHIAHVTAAMPQHLALRWAALLHDAGKPECFTMDEQGQGHFYGHAKVSAQIADSVLSRLKAPTALRQQVVELVKLHMTPIEPEKKTVRRWLSRLGEEMFDLLLTLQEGDMGRKGTDRPEEMDQFFRLRQLKQEIMAENACLRVNDLAVNGHDLMALGIRGKDIGLTLNHLLEQVLDETLPNEKDALLQSLKEQ